MAGFSNGLPFGGDGRHIESERRLAGSFSGESGEAFEPILEKTIGCSDADINTPEDFRAHYSSAEDLPLGSHQHVDELPDGFSVRTPSNRM